MTTDETGTIRVCALACLENALRANRTTHLISLLTPELMPETPAQIPPHQHLHLAFHDINHPRPGLRAPDTDQLQKMIDFAQRWNLKGELIIHCWAGVSRSTAAAFIVQCSLNPQADEFDFARQLRAASPTATPNRLMVELADTALNRDGRMIAAIAEIGTGQPLAGQLPDFNLPIRGPFLSRL